MTIATAWSTHPEPTTAFNNAYATLKDRLGGDADMVLSFYTEAYSSETLRGAANALPGGVRVHAISSCKHVMTEEGLHGEDGRAIAL